jgi:predicted nucleic acid-binding Zn ribbon protein
VSTWRPFTEGGDSGPRRVGDSLDGVAKGLGLNDASLIRAVFGRWAEIVGDHVAQHATPSAVRDGVLIITVREPVWATQLRYLESDIMKRVCDAAGAGAISGVEVRLRAG